MAFTNEEHERIMAALKERAPKPGNCTICGNDDWEVSDEFVALVPQGNTKKLKLTGAFLPFVLATCSNCGNTHLINLITLGLRDLFEERKEEKIAKEKVK